VNLFKLFSLTDGVDWDLATGYVRRLNDLGGVALDAQLVSGAFSVRDCYALTCAEASALAELRRTGVPGIDYVPLSHFRKEGSLLVPVGARRVFSPTALGLDTLVFGTDKAAVNSFVSKNFDYLPIREPCFDWAA